MRRISSAPCIHGMQQSLPVGVHSPLRPNASISSANSSISGVSTAALPLPYDVLAIQSTTPVSNIVACMYDKVITSSNDDDELAKCLATPSQAPDVNADAPNICSKTVERHIAFIEARARRNRERKNNNSKQE